MDIEGKYDELLSKILDEDCRMYPFMDAVMGFLCRRTDFFITQKNGGDIGLPKGLADKILLSIFRKWKDISRVHSKDMTFEPLYKHNEERKKKPTPKKNGMNKDGCNGEENHAFDCSKLIEGLKIAYYKKQEELKTLESLKQNEGSNNLEYSKNNDEVNNLNSLNINNDRTPSTEVDCNVIFNKSDYKRKKGTKHSGKRKNKDTDNKFKYFGSNGMCDETDLKSKDEANNKLKNKKALKEEYSKRKDKYTTVDFTKLSVADSSKCTEKLTVVDCSKGKGDFKTMNNLVFDNTKGEANVDLLTTKSDTKLNEDIISSGTSNEYCSDGRELKIADCTKDGEVKKIDELTSDSNVNTTKDVSKQTKDFSSDTFNGADRGNYRWSQTVNDIEILIPVPEYIKKSKDVNVTIDEFKLIVKVKNQSDPSLWNTLVNGELCYKIDKEESTWSISSGQPVSVHCEKSEEKWWDAFFTTEPKIDMTKLDVCIPLSALTEEEEMKLEKIWHTDGSSDKGGDSEFPVISF